MKKQENQNDFTLADKILAPIVIFLVIITFCVILGLLIKV